MSEDRFTTAVDRIRQVDGRYRKEAYAFMNDAVAYTVKKWKDADPGRKDRHVSGGELIYGTVELAVQEFGVLAPYVLYDWGIADGSAIGDIIFHLIREGVLTKSKDDSREDFNVVGALAPLFPVSSVYANNIPVPKID
ncbi:MAG: hypothetical protein IKB25_00640 [Lentisphaeria bacterium]|nr:hypothetical protein [Lentisphaeria bacterium]